MKLKRALHGLGNSLIGMGVLLALCSLISCKPGTPGDPGPRQAGSRDANPMRWVTYARQPMPDRRAGVERLLAEDAGRFWKDAARLTRQIDDWPMIRLLSEKAEVSGDRRALPWLVRSWAMRSKTIADDERPERRAIQAITQQPADRLLVSILLETPDDHEPATQVAAWSVLARIEPDDRLRLRIDDTPVNTSLLMALLQQAAPAVDVLPDDRTAVARMMRLSVAFDEAQWGKWSRWRTAHAGDGPATLGLRHLPAIRHRDPQRDVWTRGDWLSHIEARLAGRRHASRGVGGDEEIVVRQRPDRLADHAEHLGLADLIVLDHLLDMMDDPAVRRLAFEQAEADRLDTTTELGGALIFDEQGRARLKPFAPMIRRHDQAYIASTPCMDAVYLGLAHYHFHTQRYDNAAWAGPGKGDLDFAATHHSNAVVLTFLDRGTLNVDAYMPGGIIIDLGCMTR